jgi:hypothetical protein
MAALDPIHQDFVEHVFGAGAVEWRGFVDGGDDAHGLTALGG